MDSENETLQTIIEEGKKYSADKKELEENSQYYAMAAMILKDSGIKSKIIKYYLPIMNKIINQYLDHMSFFVHFELDESFTETIKSRHRDVFTYASFSEGEKRKIDLALLFAWREIAKLKNSLNCNLLIFDEVLDGSLDDIATDSFLSIINSKFFKKDTNIFVISHKPKDTLQDKFKGHLTFVKKNNFSRLDIP
jgi:DNA repair exonuclease SbcCD ATPase subunit